MDAYLELAQAVLRSERRPMRARSMLASAYRHGLVPSHLHGRTQHKTLGARISEDIVAKREESAFFRVAAGRFFLREFLTDASLPESYRQPFFARRRVRELKRGLGLTVRLADLWRFGAADVIRGDSLLRHLRKTFDRYDDYQNKKPDSIFLWSFVLLTRENWVLSYRLGRYRDDRDSFMLRRSIGFSSLVLEKELNLFNVKEDLGIIDAGVKAVTIDLDIPQMRTKDAELNPATICYFLVAHTTDYDKDILAVIDYKCPSWFEPVKRRLAINDLVWLDLSQPVNNIDDFDPWSQSVLLTYLHGAPSIAAAQPHSAQQTQRRISQGPAGNG